MNRAERRREARSGQVSPVRPSALVDAAYHRAAEAAARGDWALARRHYESCLALDPRHIEARHDLAVLVLRAGEPAAAVAHLEQVLARRPSHAGALLNIALAFCDLGNADAAMKAASRAVAIAPSSGATHAVMGHALSLRADLAGAEAAYSRSLAFDGRAGSVIARHADILRRMDRLDDSFAAYDRFLELAPGDLTACAEVLIRALGQNARQASEYKRRFVALVAMDKAGMRKLCAKLAEDGRAADAMTLVDAAVQAHPGAADFLVDRASVLHGLGRMSEALADLKRALTLDPGNPDVLFSIGRFFERFDQSVAAAPFFAEAIERRPDFVDAYLHLAAVRLANGDIGSNIALLRHARSIAPDHCYLWADLCWSRLFACDWKGLEEEFRDSLKKHVESGQAFPPFTLLAFGLPNDELALWTQVWAEKEGGGLKPPLKTYAPGPETKISRRIRVGYLSADYKDHATVLLITDLLEAHDRGRFEIFGYNIGAIDESASCRRAIRSFDHFVELFSMSDAEAAHRIADDDIDILIDLKGYTKDSRPGILSCRPAPIQVNYLGYPSSMNTPAIDYLIADAIVIPDEHRPFYSESVVQLPNSYQPNDRHRDSADPHAAREDHNLPPDGFVFCCFNSSYKIMPAVFDIWMRLLRDVPGSVIWLLGVNSAIEDNLRREAQSRGIDPARVVFAPRVAFKDHIGRMVLADLFLDTLPVNAHTTASEALWAGLPVLTCLGPHFVGRVAGSLLAAVGLPELVTQNLADYEREALALARDPARLGALRARLAENRLASPLFDTPRYARNYEAALERMVELRLVGQPPQAFTVEDHGGGISFSAPLKETQASGVCRAVSNIRQIENTRLFTGSSEALLQLKNPGLKQRVPHTTMSDT